MDDFQERTNEFSRLMARQIRRLNGMIADIDGMNTKLDGAVKDLSGMRRSIETHNDSHYRPKQ